MHDCQSRVLSIEIMSSVFSDALGELSTRNLEIVAEQQPIRINRRGGYRPGAGRKKSKVNEKDAEHSPRPEFSAEHPVHTTWRTVPEMPELRQPCFYEAVRSALVHFLDGDDFRVIHLSIQNDHIHGLNEASSRAALSLGMQKLGQRVAQNINRAWGRGGRVFEFRYAEKQIIDARYARNAISYVLNNWRRHQEDIVNGRIVSAKLDEYSSAISFGGWIGAVHGKRYQPPPGYLPLPVSEPRTALLKTEWRRFGLIDPEERPAATRW